MSWLEADAIGPVVSLVDLPVFCNALYPTAAEAQAAPRGDLQLMFSPTTGYLWNAAFDPELVAYNPAYENSLHHSPRFQAFAEDLADRLIERYGLRGRRIVEIGSGEGNFLALLCERGDNTGIGYDPSFDPERTKVVTSERMQIVREYYPTDRPIDASLVLCQHVLEHVSNPVGLVEGVRRSLPAGGDTAVYFEVPDATYMVSEFALWDLIYEHRSYFAAPALAALFRRCGFEIDDVQRAFGDQYLSVEAHAGAVEAHAGAVEAHAGATRPGDGARHDGYGDADELAKLVEHVAAFGDHVTRLVAQWTERLDAMTADGPVAVWGAGSKGVTFVNLIPAGRHIAHVIDINPNKWGLHVPGTGQRVDSPASLGADVRHVLVMNPLYVEEIAGQLHELGLHPVVTAVHG